MFENVLCVIPARGGSKGIHKKNLQQIGDKPLVAYSIVHALEAGLPKKNVLVSSDDDEVLKVAKKWGATPHRRPDTISQDMSSTEECLVDAYKSKGRRCDTVLTLQPTSPIRAKGRVCDALRVYLGGCHDSLASATKMYNFLWHEPSIEQFWESSYDPACRPMRQEISFCDMRYFENGNLYVSNAEMLMSTNCRIGPKVHIYPVTDIEGSQIDTMTDLNTFAQLFNGDIANLDVGLPVT